MLSVQGSVLIPTALIKKPSRGKISVFILEEKGWIVESNATGKILDLQSKKRLI